MTERAVVSLGVAAAIGPEFAASIAPAAEAAGFHALWVNDTPGADSLRVVDAAARVTTRLIVATGVLPIDRRPAPAIAAEVDERGVPQDRLVLGIGAGRTRAGALRLVHDAASDLRRAVSSKVVVGALGPKMRRLAAENSDGVLLSWLTPDIAGEQAAEARAWAPAATHVALYVRTALDPAARPRLQAESAGYAAVSVYAANFARLGIDAEQTVLDAATRRGSAQLEEYRQGVDEVILRAIVAEDTLDAYLRFIEDARPLL